MPLPSPLFVLAMDHRAVMRRLFERPGEPPDELAARFERAKHLTYAALEQLLDAGLLDPSSTGVLVDERYGADVARAAHARGCILFMPVEASRPIFDRDTPELEFEYGDDFAAHLEAFPIDGAKVLVVHNPEMPAERRSRQAARCRAVMEWGHAHDLPFMLEVLCPPTERQLSAAGGDLDLFQRTAKLDVVAGAIDDLRRQGVEPDVWKLEPLSGPDDYRAIASLCRDGGRSDVMCLLLGGGADIEQVRGWVAQVRDVPGYAGFAVGRAIWQAALTNLYAGTWSEAETVRAVAENIAGLVDAYRGNGAVRGARG